jgi:hypothetical protein
VKNPKTTKSSSASPAKPSATAVRGKYFNQLQRGTKLVILDPALMPYFPDSESVNRALHAFLAIGDSVQAAAAPRRRSRTVSGGSATGFDPRKGCGEHAIAAGD